MNLILMVGVYVAAVCGAEATFLSIHRWRWSTIRASCVVTLLFAILIRLLALPHLLTLEAAFFGATFVGMTDRSRMGWKRVFAASLLFATIYITLIPFAKGFGGGLGASAFISCAVVYACAKIYRERISRPEK